MFIHKFDPILFEFWFISIRWYSLAYIFGILFGWWYGKRIIIKKLKFLDKKFKLENFDDIVTVIIISIIIGGRLGYVIFYNFQYFMEYPFKIFKIWEGGMSFHGALIGVVIGTYYFSKRKGLNTLFLLDVIACVSPIGIFLGRIANFINGELVGKVTDVSWSVIFPAVDMMSRHPSQIYQALLEGVVLFFLINAVMFRKKYLIGSCSYCFLIFYGLFRIISEYFREPDPQIGYIYSLFSMGSLLSFFMILTGIVIFIFLRKKNEV